MSVSSEPNDILIVEDDMDTAEIASEFLMSCGFTCRLTHDGVSALAEIKRKTPGCIWLDVCIKPSGTSGLEILAVLTTDDELRDVPVFVNSGTDFSEKVRTINNQNAIFVMKPFELEVFTNWLGVNTGTKNKR